jgi:uncharacterized damage-inducible protein DinB
MKNPQISALIDQFNLQTRLFSNVLKDVDSKNFSRIPGPSTNNYEWLAGHVLNTRYNIANILGLNLKSPCASQFDNFKAYDSGISYLSADEVRKDWQQVSEKFITKLGDVGDNFINSPAPFKVPIGDNTMKGILAFFAHHEAYHIGQLGYLRKYLGLPAMSYD